MDWLSKIPNWVKIPLKILLPSLAIFSWIILFAPDYFIEKLYLLDFRNDSGFVIGIIFVICISLICCYLFSYLLSFLKKKLSIMISNRKYYRLFNSLADVYKSCLITMYKEPTHSMEMKYSNSVASYLEAINAIGRPQLSTIGSVFDYYLQPWVIKSIDKSVLLHKRDILKLKKQIAKCKDKDIKREIELLIDQKQKYIDFVNGN